MAMMQPGMFLSQPPMATIAVHAFAADDGFDGVGDDFAGDEGIFHAFACPWRCRRKW